MTEPVRCARCGARYDSRHVKCPRCGDRSRVAIPAAGPAGARSRAASGRGVLALTGLVAALALFGGWAWTSARTTTATPAATGMTSALGAVLGLNEPRPRPRVSRVPSVIAFVDSPAAGRREYDDGDFEKALQLFRERIEAEPSNAEAYSNAGQILVRLGRTPEALPLLERAVALDPSRWAYRFNLARAKGLMGQWDFAAQDYAEAARLFPNDYATLFNLGQALHRAGREDEAVQRYREAIQQKPDDSSFYLALGVSEEKLGHAPQAAEAYRRYVAMEPSARQAEAVAARAKELGAMAPAPPIAQ